MDQPPRKRRKTSSPAQGSSSPLRKPPRRPSFASPTKASLARNYPNLLPTRTPPRDANLQRMQVGAYGLDGAGTTHKETGNAGEEEVDIRATPLQKELEEQEGPRRGTLLLSPSKHSPHASSVVKRSPLAKARPAHQNQLNRPVEETSNPDGQTDKAKKQPLDLGIEKMKQERARLQREVEELEAQVSRCSYEIVTEQQRKQDVALLPAQRADLIEFITKISGADTQDERPTPVSSLLCSFLPFSSLTVPPPQNKHLEKAVASHRPVDLQDPLPYLEMFTSFNFSTQLNLPQGKVLPASKRVHQKHNIDISGPQKLLTAQLAVNIDCMSNEVIDMHLLRLPSWAERELGTFMRAKAEEKDLGSACWAIDSFWDITTKRAAYWHRCEKAFARLLPGRTATATDTENAPSISTKSSTLSRKDLSRHLGRDVLVLQNKHVLLKINWRIVFDWTGEAESDVSVECAVPAVWKEADASDTFRKIPETFDSLLRMKGAFEATRIMVALLFAD